MTEYTGAHPAGQRAEDVIEVYPEIKHKRTKSGGKAKGKNAEAKLVGWRFAFFRAGDTEPMLESNGCYPDEATARQVAIEVNRLLFANHYPMQGAERVAS